MSDDTKQRVVLITGATSGIGRATARLLAKSGWAVAATGRDRPRLLALEDEAKSYTGDGRIVGFVHDLAQDDGRVLVDAVVARFGALHGLVQSAGILEAGDSESTSPERFAKTMHLNVQAVYALAHHAIPHLKQQAPDAAMVNVSSVAGIRPFPGVVSYCVSKAALDQMTRCMAIELAPHGVRVNAVNPGVVVTELHRRGGMSPEQYDAFLERSKTTHPLGRVGDADEIADLILFLLSEKSGWITGETIAIDGGRHLTAAR